MNDSTPLFDQLAQLGIAAGSTIFVEGQQADCAYVILRGEVQAIAQTPNGAKIALRRMGTGEMFGEIGLLKEDGKRTATIISEEGCDLLVLPREIFDERLGQADPLLKFIIDHLCRHLLALTMQVVGRG
jgi:CRP-like cAMP-binding protein